MSTKDYVEKDYYATLGVPKDAPTDEIKKSYRKLARELHPDRNTGNDAAASKFKDVSEAYSVLSDDGKRKEYDEARALFANGGGFRFPPGGGQQPGPGGTYNVDLGDLFNGAGGAGRSGGIGDLFGGLFGQRGATQTRTAQPRRGADVETEATISFTDAVDGVTVPLRMTSAAACPTCKGTGANPPSMPRVCPVCEGSGHVSRNAGQFAFDEPCRECKGRGLIVDDPCPTCHGSGRGTTTKTMQVRIPAGVDDGQRIRLKGKGAPGERGGPSGDLYVTVHVAPHPVFGRKGDNLTVTVPVTFPEATLGADITVPTLGGAPVTLRVAPGTPNGRTMRVRGKGSTRKDGTRGDLLVTVEVIVPGTLDEGARAALESFRQATAGADPREALLRQAATTATSTTGGRT